ncbi:unnamed protein product, partial [Effrenium voratum]
GGARRSRTRRRSATSFTASRPQRPPTSQARTRRWRRAPEFRVGSELTSLCRTPRNSVARQGRRRLTASTR